MGDEQRAGLPGRADPVDALGHDAQGVDVEAGVGLVQDGDLGLEQLELQDLVALLLAAGEALVDVARREGRVHLQGGHGRLLLLHPVAQRRGLTADGGGGAAQEVRDGHAGDLDGVLHREEQAGAGALVDAHREDVLAVEGHAATRDGVLRVTGEAVGQRGLAGAVGAHDRVGLPGLDGQVDAVEDLTLSSTDTCRSRISRVATQFSSFDEDVIAIDGDGVGGDGLGRGQAGGRAGAQVEARAVQPALDGAVLDVALGQRDVGVGADVVDREDLAAGCGRRRAARPSRTTRMAPSSGRSDSEQALMPRAPAPPDAATSRSSSEGTPICCRTSVKKPSTTMRRASAGVMPRDCR